MKEIFLSVLSVLILTNSNLIFAAESTSYVIPDQSRSNTTNPRIKTYYDNNLSTNKLVGKNPEAQKVIEDLTAK